jgi:hypothetical protein
MNWTPEQTAELARQVARDAKRQAGVGDFPEIPPLLDARRGKSVRIDVPLTSIHAYRSALQDMQREIASQLEDTLPQKMKGRHVGIVLAMHASTWHRWAVVWKRRQ